MPRATEFWRHRARARSDDSQPTPLEDEKTHAKGNDERLRDSRPRRGPPTPDTRRRLAPAAIERPGRLGPGGRRRDAPPAPRAVSHIQYRPQHQLHERLLRGLRFLRVLPQDQRFGRLRARPRRAAGEDSRDGRLGRRSNPDARRLPPDVEDRVVRRTAARHQAAFSAGEHPRVQPRRVSTLSRRSSSCRRGRFCCGCATRGWAACPAGEPRFSSTACGAS